PPADGSGCRAERARPRSRRTAPATGSHGRLQAGCPPRLHTERASPPSRRLTSPQTLIHSTTRSSAARAGSRASLRSTCITPQVLALQPPLESLGADVVAPTAAGHLDGHAERQTAVAQAHADEHRRHTHAASGILHRESSGLRHAASPAAPEPKKMPTISSWVRRRISDRRWTSPTVNWPVRSLRYHVLLLIPGCFETASAFSPCSIILALSLFARIIIESPTPWSSHL